MKVGYNLLRLGRHDTSHVGRLRGRRARFDLLTTGGERIRDDDFRGKPLLVVFACESHRPHVNSKAVRTMYDLYVGKIEFLAVYSDQESMTLRERLEGARRYKEEREIEWMVAVGPVTVRRNLRADPIAPEQVAFLVLDEEGFIQSVIERADDILGVAEALDRALSSRKGLAGLLSTVRNTSARVFDRLSN